MYNIALIGAGQLGSRHLQGLKKGCLEMSIYVVDVNEISLKLSEERYAQVESNQMINSIHFLKDIDYLPHELDLVIIATSSAVRASITTSLLKLKLVKNILFEKFLFPSISEYSSISELLKNKGVKAWVNCSRRIYSCYIDLKVLLQGSKEIDYSVVGGQWGLACNAIHFIDNFAMLTGITNFQISTLNLDKKILDSKRHGYIEFTGTIDSLPINKKKFSITSQKNSAEPLTITIKTEVFEIIIKEHLKELMIINKDGSIISREIEIPFQSQLTGKVAEAIILTGSCELTKFEESSDLHLRFLKPIVNFYNEISKKNGDFCPIT